MRLARGRTLAALAGVLASLAGAQAASADTYCVGAPAGATCTGPSTDLQTALDNAAGHPNVDGVADEVAIGPGTFSNPSGYTYPTGGDALTVTGAGQGPTVLGFTSGVGFTAQSAGVTVSDLSMSVPASQTGFDLQQSGTLRRVAISIAAGAVGARLAGGSTADGVSVTSPDVSVISFGLSRTGSPGTAPITVTNSSLTAYVGIDVNGGPRWDVDHSRFNGRLGMNLTSVDANVANSLFETTVGAGGPAGLNSEDGTTHSLSVTNVTALNRGGGGGSGVVANANGISHATLTVAGSLFGGFDTVESHVGDVAVALDSNAAFPVLGDTPVANVGTVASHDYRPLAGSALIDRLDDAGAGATDFSGVDARAVPFVRTGPGPHRDIGAFELRPQAPVVSVSASNGSPATGEEVTFTAVGSDPDPGDQLTYLWSFDGGPSSAAGTSVPRAFAGSGPHTASVTVVDLSRRTASASTTVVIPAPAPTRTPVVTPASNLRPGTCVNPLNGTPAADKLTGSAFGDAIVGGGGNDVLSGLAGNDCLIGDEGNDSLDGGDGGDDLRGLAGNDKVRGGAGNDNLLGGSGKDALDGGAGVDSLTGGSGVDRFSAGAGNDKLNAADGKRERVSCGSGRDSVAADRIDRLIGCEKKHLRGPRR